MKTQRILIVEDDINAAKVLARILANEGYVTDCVPSAEAGFRKIAEGPYDLLIIDMILPRMDGLAFLKEIKAADPDLLTVIVTAYGSITSAVTALKAGADDFLEKPLVPEKLLHVIRKAFEEQRLKNEIVALKSNLVKLNHYHNIIGSHPKMQVVFQLIDTVKDTDVAVFITGETGTGKELVARAIHFQSRRQTQPFVAINCASVPGPLFESELFGYERGAFTGALKRKLGKLEQAQGGTVLLDEIGDMPIDTQGKLLRSLQERKIERLGSEKADAIPLDIRIISATNKDVTAEVACHRFRIDLFYRLNVVPIHLPPLRDRMEDIPLLADHFLKKAAGERGQPPPSLSDRALAALMSHSWPGNVREFENTIKRAMVLNPGRVIEAVPLLSGENGSEAFKPPLSMDPALPFRAVREKAMAEVEEHYLKAVLKRYRGSIKETAAHSGINVRTVRRKMKAYGLDKWDYR